MKTTNLFMLLLCCLLFTGLNAQRVTPNNFKLTPKPPTGCQNTYTLPLQGGRVHNPNNTISTKVKFSYASGQFHMKAVAPVGESDYQWAKFSFKPGYPTADIKGVTVRYSVKPSPNNSAKTCYISQTRMIQGPTAGVGTVKIDDGTNLYGSGSHTASGSFLCGNDYKTVALKLVMQPGDEIIIHSIVVIFKCPVIITYNCPVGLPNPQIQLDGSYDQNGYTYYKVPVVNYMVFPNFLFSPAPTLPACGANANSARTWVDLYDQNNNRIYGFCAFGQSSDMKKIWFAVKKGEKPPYRVKVVLKDRGCNKEYHSNWISIPQS